MNLQTILKDTDLITCLKNNLYESNIVENLEDNFKMWNDIIASPEIPIPILGIQGTGKTSLLNSLIMGDCDLPIDVNETTCIPTEIRYSENAESFVDIVFKNKNSLRETLTQDAIEKYVHNDYNPANEKQVEKIVVYKNNKLLNSGVVFVDLPGYGSLTQENVETTMNFLQKSVAAVFIFRTIPPLTDQEATFIKMAWSSLAKAFFVQNEWMYERREEVKDAKKHNTKILKDISKKIKKTDSDMEIFIVNIEKALRAVIKDDYDDIKSSGLTELEKSLSEFTRDWKSKIKNNISNNIIAYINHSLNSLDLKMDNLNKNKDEAYNQYLNQKSELESNYKRYAKEIESQLNDIKMVAELVKNELQELIRKEKGQLKTEMRKKIYGGIVDGEDLNQAFSETVNEANEKIINTFYDLLYSEVEPKIKELIESTSDYELNNLHNIFNLGIDKKTKWERLIEPLSSASVGIGGWLGGAKVGAALGSAGGPIGAVVGGILGGLLGLFAGHKTKKYISKVRSEEALKVVLPEIDNWEKEIMDTIISIIDKISNETTEKSSEIIEEIHKNFQNKNEALIENINKTEKEKEEIKQNIDKDINFLNNYLKKLEEL